MPTANMTGGAPRKTGAPLRFIAIGAALVALALLAGYLAMTAERERKAAGSDRALAALRQGEFVGNTIAKAQAAGDELNRQAAGQQPVQPMELSPVSTGHITAVREKNFDMAAIPPKPMLEALSDMAASRKQPTVALSDNQMDGGMVSTPSLEQPAAVSLKSSAPGSLVSSPLPYAPVSCKVFRDGPNYFAFVRSHPATKFPKADFGRQMVLMLVSTSEFPNRIFQAVEASDKGGRLTLKYRINPFLAAEEVDDTYSTIVVGATKSPVELEQIQ